MKRLSNSKPLRFLDLKQNSEEKKSRLSNSSSKVKIFRVVFSVVVAFAVAAIAREATPEAGTGYVGLDPLFSICIYSTLSALRCAMHACSLSHSKTHFRSSSSLLELSPTSARSRRPRAKRPQRRTRRLRARVPKTTRKLQERLRTRSCQKNLLLCHLKTFLPLSERAPLRLI